MKKHFLKASLLALLGAANFQDAVAQFDLAPFMRAGKEDANKLINAYMSPLMTGWASGINNGWYNTAKPHGTGGFDITASFGVFFIPTDAMTFNPSSLGLNSVEAANPSGKADVDVNNAPTAFSDKQGPTWQVNYPNNADPNRKSFASFEIPKGPGVSLFATLPTAQFAIGIYKNTEVMLRFLPEINAAGVKASLFGFGIKHDIKQWIPGVKDMPFDLSAIFAYSTSKASYTMDGDKALMPPLDSNKVPLPGSLATADYQNQTLEFKTSGWMLGLIVSKKLGPLTPYLGVNYNNSSVEMNMKGTYPVTIYNPAYNNGNGSFGRNEVLNVSDPIALTGSANGFRANAGFRIKLLILTIHADYTFAKYNMLTAGVGINLQSIVPFKL